MEKGPIHLSTTKSCPNPYYNGRYSWRGCRTRFTNHPNKDVLILIIMEDTHGAICVLNHFKCSFQVLILIIMEDTHGVGKTEQDIVRQLLVLILIIMEDTHGAPWLCRWHKSSRPNPYYNGRYSWR